MVIYIAVFITGVLLTASIIWLFQIRNNREEIRPLDYFFGGFLVCFISSFVTSAVKLWW